MVKIVNLVDYTWTESLKTAILFLCQKVTQITHLTKSLG
jgi:hypothetical protein